MDLLRKAWGCIVQLWYRYGNRSVGFPAYPECDEMLRAIMSEPPSHEYVELIEWPERRPLRNIEYWARNVATVHWLCSLGIVTKWVAGEKGKDTYTKMPYHYDVAGVKVEFLPHWGFVTVGGVNRDVPSTEAELRAYIEEEKSG